MLLVITSLLPTIAFAALHTAVVDYKQGDTALEGYTAYNEGMTEKSPGVLVVHDWMGLNDHYKTITQKLADLGYIAFAVDIYGKGVRPKDSQQAAAEAGKIQIGPWAYATTGPGGFGGIEKEQETWTRIESRSSDIASEERLPWSWLAAGPL